MAYQRLTNSQIESDPKQQLRTLTRKHRFLVAVDSDGCVADNMNGKQILIFHPLYMEFYQLWEIETYFREVAEYYSLFSLHRGCNRFLAVLFSLRALCSRPDVRQAAASQKVCLPPSQPVEDYINFAQSNQLGLGNPGLEKFLTTRPMDWGLHKLLSWSQAVNRTFPFLEIPPFENVRQALALMAEKADLIVVSQTPYEDLANFWEKYNLTGYIQLIAGQEMGSKTDHIQLAREAGDYPAECVLMIGDADGDRKAVKQNQGFFYPVPPGQEEQAWKNLPFFFEQFVQGIYGKEGEEKLLSEFSRVLLSSPPWEKADYNHISAYREKQELRLNLYRRFHPSGRLKII